MTVKNKAKRFFNRWRKEYDFKTFINASGSLAATLFFALYNGFLGIWHSSLWHGTICCYYLMLFLVRGLIIAAAKRISMRSSRNEERARDKVYFAASFLLLLLNISLILPVSLMVVQRKPVSLTLTPAIVMAAYTTCKVTMAAVNLRKRRKSSDCLVWLLRTVNFMDALVSILTLVIMPGPPAFLHCF